MSGTPSPDDPHLRVTGKVAGCVSLLALLVLLSFSGCGGRRTHGPAVEPATRAQRAGVYHELERGQTLYTLSRVYQIPLEDLIRVNQIEDPTDIPAGTPIFIPGATRKLPYPAWESARLAWPLRGPITSRYGRRGSRSHHAGLDIDGRSGDLIRAAASGRVVHAGRGGSYGRFVIIDHGGGLQTLYAHASRLLVKRGTRVAAGDPVAEVGRSGNARGTHLHFEVRRNGVPVDPLPYLHAAPRAAADR